MIYSFQAIIYKKGVNPCVDIPVEISDDLASKGYIPIKGSINNFSFKQTLVPVKNAGYRLFVNMLMLKGGNAKVGEQASFKIEKDPEPRTVPMPSELKVKLEENKLMKAFYKQTSSRQKDILNYLNYLKTETALIRNVNKVVNKLKRK